jgi:hypothetical protein
MVQTIFSNNVFRNRSTLIHAFIKFLISLVAHKRIHILHKTSTMYIMIISGRFFDHFCNHGQKNPWKFEVSANVHQGSSKCCDIPSEAYEQVRQTSQPKTCYELITTPVMPLNKTNRTESPQQIESTI